MNFFTLSDINIFSAVILVIVYYFTNDYHTMETRTRTSFKNLTLSVFFLIVLDLLWNAVNGRDGMLFFYLNNFINFFRNAFSVLPPILWANYIFNRLNDSPEKITRYNRISSYIFTGILIMTALSPLFGVVYKISPDNLYSRGPMYFVLVLIAICYMLTGAYMIIRNKEPYRLKKAISLLSFVVFPLLGLLIQLLFYGVTLVWNFSAISIFIIYLRIQSKEQTTDYLTGLNTRAAFDNYINMKVEASVKKDFALIMIDIDKFKIINDQYGHISGDEALVVFSEVIRQSVRSTDFIARYGGDEFVILIDCEHRKDVDHVLNRIKKHLDEINQTGELRYNLDFSYGSSFFREAGKNNSDKFIDHVDQLMYQQKHFKKTISAKP